MNLVIVESPAKAKTIERYLGSGYKVLASFGHVRDLPQRELGIDVEHNFQPQYRLIAKARKTISLLSKSASEAKTLYLATDLDREGEAIAWHLLYALKIKENSSKVKRIVFNEITKSAIERAVAHPRQIDDNLVDAQQARRVLDRLVGYKLSPLLWKKVKSGLSAGRVQSVAVRLIVEREEEVRNFKAEEYWVLAVDLSKIKENQIFRAFLIEKDGKEIKKLDIKSGGEANKIKEGLASAHYKVFSVEKKEAFRRPSPPFITSTLQMEASRKLGLSAKQTMTLAQKLYEAGHITYMRTDSANLSAEAVFAARNIIKLKFGEQYLPMSAQQYKSKNKRAQEAHEAIRPTHFDRERLAEAGREQKLYELIWQRTIASQMKPAVLEVIEAKIRAKAKSEFVFRAVGERVVFEGFIKLYTEGRDEEISRGSIILPPLKAGESLTLRDLVAEQKFTEAPKRYSEATLVKKLESLGIGRPSTYAPTLSTIQERGYVNLTERRFQPTEIGEIVSKLLVEHFADIVDYQFTARLEDELDEIAAGEQRWVPVIEKFYQAFSQRLERKMEEINKKDVVPEQKLKEGCPECGSGLLIKLGKFGKFIACSAFPQCKYSRPLESKKEERESVVLAGGRIENLGEAEEEKCEKCGGKMILKEGRFGKFLACSNYPKCKNTKSLAKLTGIKCPDCGQGDVIERRSKKGRVFWGCSRYPECKYATWELPNAKIKNHNTKR